MSTMTAVKNPALQRDLADGSTTWNVTLTGIRPLMFDRYAGDNNTKLQWWEKVYMVPGTRQLCIPSLNIMSFFSAHNTNSAPKRLRDKRKYKDIANACLAFITIEHDYIPILRNDEPLVLGPINGESDPVTGLHRQVHVARLDKGIPNPKERPCLPLPWALKFTMRIGKNKEIKESEIRSLLEEGGQVIGLGTFRGVFGKFSVSIDTE